MKRVTELLPRRAKPEQHTGRNIAIAAGAAALAAYAVYAMRDRITPFTDQARALAADARDSLAAGMRPLTDRAREGVGRARTLMAAPAARGVDSDGGRPDLRPVDAAFPLEPLQPGERRVAPPAA